MNIDKLLGLQSRLDTNTITNADALRWIIDALLDDANSPEPPDSSPRVDRSLRGWVAICGHGQTIPAVATAKCLYVSDEDWSSTNGEWSWEHTEMAGWAVRKLSPEDIGYKVRRWDEWTQEEQDSHHHAHEVCRLPLRLLVDKAIDIALRGTHE